MLKIIQRDASWSTGRFYLPMHPSHLLESNCPKCGEMSIGDHRLEGAAINMGERYEPNIVRFTCYGRGSTPDTDCDTEWQEKIVIRITVDVAKESTSEKLIKLRAYVTRVCDNCKGDPTKAPFAPYSCPECQDEPGKTSDPNISVEEIIALIDEVERLREENLKLQP